MTTGIGLQTEKTTKYNIGILKYQVDISLSFERDPEEQPTIVVLAQNKELGVGHNNKMIRKMA